MAKNNPKILLGFEDELITEKNKGLVDFNTNKIGGTPNTPNNFKLEASICPLCQLPRPLVVQIYAPLENSNYHRTLYLFACINPKCWNNADSWVCIRIQSQQDTNIEQGKSISTKTSDFDWCTGADEWDDENNVNMDEENGNVVNSNVEKISDEDDESCSLEESIRSGLGSLSVDEKNANIGAQGGAVGRLHSPAASAEIEGDEGEIISIDTPTMPQHNLVALFQEATPVPQEFSPNSKSNTQKYQFVSSFITVSEESINTSSTISDRHVKELLQEYQRNDDFANNLSSDLGTAPGGGLENYEKSAPAHGDKMFHHFLTRVQSNPGQILRYCREVGPPLLIYPLGERLKRCQYCQSEQTIEFQLLPTLIPKLTLTSDTTKCSRLEFGTILVFTCLNSCWSTDTSLRYETVILQKEVY